MMAAPNGMNPVPGAPYAPGGGIFPNAGHHNDVQHIWKLVEELSSQLQANREKYEDLRESLARAQARPQTHLHQPQENGLVNGDNASHSPSPSSSQSADAANQIAHLTNQLNHAQTRIHELQSQTTSQDSLLVAYESSIQEITARLRQHAFEQQNHTIALHAHYNSLLEQSRNETVQAQLVHQAWQAGLGRLAGRLREAFDEVSEGGMKGRKRIAALKEENEVLRRMVGWEATPEGDTSDEDSDDERGVGAIEEMGRGRLGLGLQ